MEKQPLSYLIDRSSVRKYKDKEVEEEKVEKLIKAAQRAPTAGNMQPYSFILIDDENKRKELYKLSGEQKWVEEAPLVIFACIDLRRDKRFTEYFGGEWADSRDFGRLLFPIIDVSLATQNMVTAAEMIGLGSVIIGTSTEHPEKVEELLELPELVYPLILVCLGYPDHEPEKTYRWNSDAVVHRDSYEETSEEQIEKYGEKIEKNRDMKVEKFIKKMEEHYNPDKLRESFQRMTEYFHEG